MSNLLRTLCIPFLGLLLPAQEGDKPKTQEPATKQPATKVESQAPAKDDAVTAKDPAIKAIDKFIADKNINKKQGGWKLSLSQPPKVEFDANSDYFWHIETELGAVTIRYLPDNAPVHVTSGLYLARLGFYDGLNFHRIMPGFMAQGGCPLGSGSGSPGYKFPGEFQGPRKHDRPGILSMANAGPGTDGSQFFITFAPQTGLNGGYTVWGEVTDGMPTLKALEGKGRSDNNGMLDVPVKLLRSWVTVAAKPKAPEAPKAAEKPKEGDKK